nr:MAG TPA: hypothetical protein [Bacteriophage sp.]
MRATADILLFSDKLLLNCSQSSVKLFRFTLFFYIPIPAAVF